MENVHTDTAPEAKGPYSQAIVSNGMVYTAGQIPLTPSGDIVEGDVAAQTKQVLENLKNVLEAAGSSMDKVVKATVYLSNLDDFAAMNEVYGEYLGHKPARSTVRADLVFNVKVEIDLIAEL